jgi:RHS repeat-associated protein
MSGQTLQKGFVPLAGGSMAVYNSSGLAYYRHSDWLGSSRFASTPARALYFDGAYGPFGESYAQSGTADLSFTGMNQDTVSNLLDFPAREYNSIHGRWPSPDPGGVSSVQIEDPQTINRYGYARNSPLSVTDPTGMHLGDWEDDLFGGGDDGGCFMCGTDNSSYFYGLELSALFGGNYYDIPGMGGYGQNGAQAEPRYVSIITDGWDPVLGIDQDSTQYYFDNAPDNPYENQKEYDAIQVGEAACVTGDAGDIADCIQQVYNGMGGPIQTDPEGGNYNFSYANITINGEPLDPQSLLGCGDGFGWRCGDMPSIHFNLNVQTFHVDTANPQNFPFGTAVHLIVDYILGNTVLSSGIPR